MSPPARGIWTPVEETGPFILRLRDMFGNDSTVQVCPDTTIIELKEQLRVEKGEPVEFIDSLRLLYSGQPLEDDATVGSYALSRKTTVSLSNQNPETGRRQRIERERVERERVEQELQAAQAAAEERKRAAIAAEAEARQKAAEAEHFVPESVTVSGTNAWWIVGKPLNDRWDRDGDSAGRPQWRRKGNHRDKLRWEGGSWRICQQSGAACYTIASNARLPPKHGWQGTGDGGASGTANVNYDLPPGAVVDEGPSAFVPSWESYAASGATFFSFPTGKPGQRAETFRFERSGDTYATIGSSSGRNEYYCRDGLLVHKQDSSTTCRLDANGDFVWSHGYSSRPERPIGVSSDAAPQPQSMSLNPPPSPNPIHPEGQNFFWRYFTGDELCVCGSPHGGHNACCEVLLCGPCMHGEITEWTTGTNKCGEWLFWPILPCLIESDRRAIERKIHNFHKERGDPTAPEKPASHCGACICAMCCGWPMAAQNVQVMKNFRAIQGQ